VQIQFAAPGVKQLDGGGSGGNLRFEIGNCGLSNAMEQ